MKSLFKGSTLIVIVMMLSVMTGCAVFSGGEVPKTRLVEPTEGQTKPTLSYQIDSNARSYHLFSNARYPVNEEFLEELQMSQYFKEISKESTGADIELYVWLGTTRNFEGSVKGAAATIGLFGFMIPTWTTDHYEIRAEVKNKKGQEKEYVINDSAKGVFWFPLVVFIPFTYNTVENVRRNMYEISFSRCTKMDSLKKTSKYTFTQCRFSLLL